jgi:hypothetical protein
VTPNSDASSIARGAGHSRPCSSTTWWSLEVHPHIPNLQAFIFPTPSSPHPNFTHTAIIFSNKDHCRSILCLTRCTRSGRGSDDSSAFPQCRTSREMQHSPNPANVLNASEAGSWPSVWRLSSSEGAGSYPSFRLPGRIGNSTKFPLFPPPLPKHRRKCPGFSPRIYRSELGIGDQGKATGQDDEAKGDPRGEEDKGDGQMH